MLLPQATVISGCAGALPRPCPLRRVPGRAAVHSCCQPIILVLSPVIRIFRFHRGRENPRARGEVLGVIQFRRKGTLQRTPISSPRSCRRRTQINGRFCFEIGAGIDVCQITTRTPIALLLLFVESRNRSLLPITLTRSRRVSIMNVGHFRIGGMRAASKFTGIARIPGAKNSPEWAKTTWST